jgi:hypothetical protein
MLWQDLSNMGVDERVVGLLREIYTASVYKFQLGGVETGWIPSEVGLRQGCPLSSLLFAVYLRSLEQEIAETGCGFKLRGDGQETLSVPGAFYADDVGLSEEEVGGMQRMLDCCITWGDRRNMKLSNEKSAFLCFGTMQRNEVHLKLGGESLRRPRVFKYLGGG